MSYLSNRVLYIALSELNWLILIWTQINNIKVVVISHFKETRFRVALVNESSSCRLGKLMAILVDHKSIFFYLRIHNEFQKYLGKRAR